MPRMKILNSLEREAFESPPHFNSAERKRFFSLPQALDSIAKGLKTPANQVCFIVAAGYFQARRKFFAKQFRPPDVEFVARQSGLNARDLTPIVAALALNHEGVRHYAYSVIKSRIAQVSRRDNEDRYLHLLAFVVYQTHKLNDTLVDTLLLAAQAAVNAAEKPLNPPASSRWVLSEAIRNGSVATWKHFNLHGEFDFSDERMVDSVGLTPKKSGPVNGIKSGGSNLVEIRMETYAYKNPVRVFIRLCKLTPCCSARVFF